jgi:hypothetical protein
MTDKNQNPFNSDDIFNQFNRLIESSVPEEYKDLLKNTQKQGSFFTHFIQSIEENADLTSFWSIPETLGFTQTKTGPEDWFSSFFKINNPAIKTEIPNFTSDAFNLFSTEYLNEATQYQNALRELSEFHQTLNETALEKFETLKSSLENSSPEVLCQLWLQAGEMAFKEISSEQRYIDAQQKVFESLGKLNTKHTDISEHISNTFGLPKQEDLDALQQGLHDLRTEFAEYREQTEEKIHKLQKRKPSSK